MADSTLDLTDSTPPAARKGQGTRALGPATRPTAAATCSSGIYEDDADLMQLDTGTNEDVSHGIGAVRDVGDAT